MINVVFKIKLTNYIPRRPQHNIVPVLNQRKGCPSSACFGSCHTEMYHFLLKLINFGDVLTYSSFPEIIVNLLLRRSCPAVCPSRVSGVLSEVPPGGLPGGAPL